jgi:RNA polymerase sigma-54 factor
MHLIQSHQLRPQTTAHLAQTMALLNMTSVELKQRIETELAQNPALELVDEHRCRACGRTLVQAGPCPLCSQRLKHDSQEPIVFTASEQDFYQGLDKSSRTNNTLPEDLPDDNLSPTVDLASFVLSQIAADLNEDQERLIAAHILTSLDNNGLLDTDPGEISRYHHVPLSRVESVLTLIRRAEPNGVGATSPKEALLVQLEILGKTQPIPVGTRQAIQKGMNLLSRHHYAQLGKQLGLSTPQIEEIAHFIGANLNPYPARAYWGNIRQGSETKPQVYHRPDIIIRHLDEHPDSPFVVEILFPIRGALRINPLFRQEIKKASADMALQWQHDFDKANLLIKCLRQRGNTMQQLMTNIATQQREFINFGDKHLKPITRASVAEILDVHESTISRAVSGKTTQLPNGRIIPLSQFFDRSLPIRSEIRDIIADEKKFLTDSQVAGILSEKGYNIARRTVAKYRTMEGIPSARTRQNLIRI